MSSVRVRPDVERAAAARLLGALALLLLFAAACTLRLAPSRELSLRAELAALNVETQTLLASVDTGADADTYPLRAASYERVIGGLHALELQARARQPLGPARLARAEALLRAGGIASAPAVLDPYPSARALRGAARSVQQMRELDRGGGLRGGVVAALANQTSVYLAQALTFETQLER
jgi:hypothetical protein